MDANVRFEPPFRTYCLGKVLEHERLTWNNLRAGGAEWVGCSPKTAERYLEKLTGPEGQLAVVVLDGVKWVVLRESLVNGEGQGR